MFNWREYEIQAKWLHSNASAPGSTEASYRTAVSRVYYAAFHNAVAFAIENGFEPQYNADDHRRLLLHFRDQRSEMNDRIRRSLKRMRDNRRQADYDAELQSAPERLADLTLQEAEKLSAMIEHLRG